MISLNKSNTVLQTRDTSVEQFENTWKIKIFKFIFRLEKTALHVGQKKRKSKIKSVRFVVEQFFGWLKGRYRGIGARYARNSDNYLGFVYLATILIYWRVLG